MRGSCEPFILGGVSAELFAAQGIPEIFVGVASTTLCCTHEMHHNPKFCLELPIQLSIGVLYDQALPAALMISKYSPSSK